MFLLPAQAQIRWRSVGLRHAKILEAQIPDFSEKSGIWVSYNLILDSHLEDEIVIITIATTIHIFDTDIGRIGSYKTGYGAFGYE